MPANPEVVVVIPNYNGQERLRQCLTSVFRQTYTHFTVVVVDNASSDASCVIVAKEFPQIRLIRNQNNAGWGEACNIGMRAVASRYALVLNNDAYLDDRCLAVMVQALEAHPECSACACRILLWDQPELAEVCGLAIYPDGSSCARGRLEPAAQYNKTEEVFAASGCCALYRRSLFETVGYFDPDFFMYCDDTDIGWRSQLIGLKCIYTPDALVYHSHSQAAGSYSELKAFHVERNRIWVAMKHFSLPHLLLGFFYALARYADQLYLALCRKKGALAQFRKKSSLGAGFLLLLKAHIAAFSKVPTIWQKRRAIQKLRKITNRDIDGLFERFGVTTRQMAGYE